MEEKLSYEYQIFQLDCMRQSKSGIYARSREIDIKKRIVPIIKRQVKKVPEAEEKLLVLDNILEEAYLYVTDNQETESLENLIRMWLDSIIESGRCKSDFFEKEGM